MKDFEIFTKYFIYDVDNHKEHKENILSLIDKLPVEGIKTEHCKIENTDWNLPSNIKREYLQYFYHEIARNLCMEFNKKFNLKAYRIHNGWYQQYNKGEYHGWHTHAGCNFTNIYFLEMPEKEMVTEVLDMNNNPIEIKAKEGQILILPGFLHHRSKVNNFNSRKTIISFNSSFVNLND